METFCTGSNVTLVTGSTGTIGRAIVRTLTRAGMAVVASARSHDALKELAREQACVGHRLAGVTSMDLTSNDSVVAAVEKMMAEHRSIIGLVNCVAAPIFGEFFELSDEEWETVIQVKLMGYVRVLRAVLPHMMRQRCGAIVNVAGRGGRQPTPVHLPGCCANIAVITLTKGLADIYAMHGIRINAVSPGPIESPRQRDIEARNQQLGAMEKKLPPLQRLGQADDVANAVSFLLSAQAAFITGANIAVDGGSMPTI